MKKERLRGVLLLLVTAAASLCAVFLTTDGLCAVRRLTGYPCPGCGMTRAVLSALRLDFRAAFAYHPLWVTLPLLFVLALRAATPRIFRRILAKLRIPEKTYPRVENVLVWVLLCAFFAVWVIRLADGWRGV